MSHTVKPGFPMEHTHMYTPTHPHTNTHAHTHTHTHTPTEGRTMRSLRLNDCIDLQKWLDGQGCCHYTACDCVWTGIDTVLLAILPSSPEMWSENGIDTYRSCKAVVCVCVFSPLPQQMTLCTTMPHCDFVCLRELSLLPGQPAVMVT